MQRLRLVFMGTPDFAVPALQALIEAGHEIACVYTQPPRPTGRGQKPKPSPVQRLAEGAGLALRTPESFRDPDEVQAFVELETDAGVVVAYGLILPSEVIAAPRLGCLNAHASLLPRWRGAAPIERALLAGDRETGVTVIRLEEKLDAGPIVLSRRVPISPATTAQDLHDELARLAGPLLLEALEGIASGRLTPRPQPAEGVSYAPKVRKEEGRIDWHRPPEEIERKVRALSPSPGAYFRWRGARIKVLAARPAAPEAVPRRGRKAPPGEVLDSRLTVACGGESGALRLLTLQREGRRASDVEAFLRGFPIPPGANLAAPCPATS